MSDGSAAPDALDGAATVLMITPGVRDAPVSACAALITNGRRAFDRVVGVTICQSPSDWLDAWGRHAGSTTASLTCVDVDSKTRSTAAASGTYRPTATLRTVPDAADLEALGETLIGIMADADAVDDRIAVCLHSLTGLLGHASQEQAFGFLCALGERARKHDAVVYVHLDASGHERATVEVFAAVCDAVVEFDENVEMQVR